MKRKKHSKHNGSYEKLIGKLPEPVYLSREEIIKQIEEEAREIRGISAHELLSAYRHGKLKNQGDVRHLLILSGLLRKDDPIFA